MMPNDRRGFICLLSVVIATTSLSACNSGSTTPSDKVAIYHNMCSQVGGYFQYGIINSPPNSDYPQVTNYEEGTDSIEGIPLSHTYIEMTSAIDGYIYEIAIDNVFADNYDPFSYTIPTTYITNLTAGSTIYLCSGNPKSVPYPVNVGESNAYAKQGFDWVHTNCGASGYFSNYKNGFLYDQNNQNLTNSQQYCYLWP